MEEEERAQLLGRTGADQSAAWQSGLDDEAQAMSHVRRSKQVLEETFQTGAAILTSMAGQRERLKVRCSTSSGQSMSFADALLSVFSLAFEEQQDSDSYPFHKSGETRTDELSVLNSVKAAKHILVLMISSGDYSECDCYMTQSPVARSQRSGRRWMC